MSTVLHLPTRPSRLTLLQGGGDLPEAVQSELYHGFHRAFPRSLKVSDGIWLRYTVQSLGFDPEDFGVTARQLTGWIEIAGQHVGMIQLDEWLLDPWTTRQEFLEATDSFSQMTADFGVAVASAWSIRRIAEEGPLVELSRIWMRPDHAKRRLWARAVQALIQKRYAGRFSLLLLNTWPADYKEEEAEQHDWRGISGWDRRRTSMGRLARAVLDVRPLPKGCVPEDRWWQWRALRPGVPRPRRR